MTNSLSTGERARYKKLAFLVGLSAITIFPHTGAAQAITPVPPANQLSVSVKPTVTTNQRTGLFTFSYEVSNANTSSQEVSFVAIQFAGADIINPTSPPGWTFAAHSDRPIVSWRATDVPAAPSGVDTGDLDASPFQIKPGQTLIGFSFQSHSSAGPAQFFVQGFTGLPGSTGDAGLLDLNAMPDFTQNSVSGPTSGPVSTANVPSVDDFMTVVNLNNGVTFAVPFSIGVRFGRNGETVERTSFQALLNGSDVTAAFKPSGSPENDLAALFSQNGPPLLLGRNVLVTSVNGFLPGASTRANDQDRFVFVLQRLIGDVNSDGKVDCGDITIVKAAFGSRYGMPKYDARADVNLDGVVDIRDLAFVSQKLTTGTYCP